MKSIYVSELRQASGSIPVSGGLFALSGVEVRKAKNDAPFLSLTLSDKTGSLPGILFDQDAPPHGMKIGDAVLVWGSYDPQFGNLKLQRIVRFNGEPEPGDFLATSPKDIPAMVRELEGIIGSLANSYLRQLLSLTFGEDPQVRVKFPRWAAAKEAHHAYIGGLLEHTLTVAQLCLRSADLYEVDRDLLVSGALLHDIGKLQEMDCGLTISYTEVGNLLGHSLLGTLLIREKIQGITGFPNLLALGLLHIIASHQGRREWGAIVEPMTEEAFLVSTLDLADSKATRGQALIREQRPQEQSISRYDRFLETRVWAPKPEEGV